MTNEEVKQHQTTQRENVYGYFTIAIICVLVVGLSDSNLADTIMLVFSTVTGYGIGLKNGTINEKIKDHKDKGNEQV